MPRPKRNKAIHDVPLHVDKVDAHLERATGRASASGLEKESTASVRRSTRRRAKSARGEDSLYTMSGALPIDSKKRTTRRTSARHSKPAGRRGASLDNPESYESKDDEHGARKSAPKPIVMSQGSGQVPEDIQTRSDVRAMTGLVVTGSKAHTPERALPSDDNDSLYGLSPGGQQSRARLEVSQSQLARRGSVSKPKSVFKSYGTPGFETSIMSLNKFRRRARQGSIIRQVQLTSELGDLDDFSLGNFSPEDESTPLNLAKGKADVPDTSEILQEPVASHFRKPYYDEADIQVPRSSPILRSSPPPVSVRHASPSLPASIPFQSTKPKAAEEVLGQEPFSETMAPPLSSSPAPSPPKITRRTKTRRGRGNTKKRVKRGPGPSTEALQTMLPRRRRLRQPRQANARRGDDSPAASTADDSEDASEDFLPIRKPLRRLHTTAKATPNKKTPAAKKKTPARLGHVAKPGRSDVLGTSRSQKTYGKDAHESDKENESFIPDDEIEETVEVEKTLDQLRSPAKKKLEHMKRKFAEVDEWEMEFEVCDMGAETNGPCR